MNKVIRYLTLLIILIVFTLFTPTVSFSQPVTIPEDTQATATLDEVQEIINIKDPVVVEGKLLLYIGATDNLSAKQRSLNISTAINMVLQKARSKNLKSIKLKSVPSLEGYEISSMDIDIVEVTPIDSEVNNIEIDNLTKVWSYNIEFIINELLLSNKSNLFTDYPVKIVIGFVCLLAVLLIIEFMHISGAKSISLFGAKILQFLIQYLRRKKNEAEDFLTGKKASIDNNKNENLKNYTENESELQDKITGITNEFNTILTTFLRILQLISVIIYVNFILYVIPSTNPLVDAPTHFFISLLEVFLDNFQQWLFAATTWESIGRIVIIALTTIIISFLINIILSSSENIIKILSDDNQSRAKRVQTISKMIKTTLILLIIAFALLLIISELGINITPIIAGAGILGLAISFGAQSLVKDIINGLFILIENQFGIGDIVSIGDLAGVVEDMNLRVTTLRDLSGRAHIIPNGQITSVTVLTKEWARANLNIGIAYKEDINTAIEIMKQTADQMRIEFPDKIIEEPEIPGVDCLNDSSVDIKIIMKTKPAQQWFVEREYRKRIKYAFDDHNIEIPFPHRTLYVPQNVGYEQKSQNNSQSKV